MTKSGIEVLGRWGNLFIIIVISFTFILVLLFIPNMNMANIQPTLSGGIKSILLGAVKLYSFPFSQLVVFSMVISSFRRKKSPYKVYLLGSFIGGLILLITFTSVLLVVGIDSVTNMYYPTYSAISRIEVMKLGRIEILSGPIFSFGGFIKISVHLLAICIGIAKIFNCSDYRFIVIPVTQLLINQSYFTWDSAMSFYEFDGEMMLYFAFPFRTIFPIILLIVAKVRNRSRLIRSG
ncbi:GerAB/ArcD/ProY family transporter [Wukongibacter baidiensis]|uniref:GerAB/ArcD/ProY family transporter n=1 Tax=Wukongibacter baidiensis TaxID=1723361 RepID=UPI003D7F5F3F